MTILSSKEYLVLGVTLALSGSIGMAVIVAGHVIRCASNCSTIWVALEMSELTGHHRPAPCAPSLPQLQAAARSFRA